jgi:hypothetical protein
MTDKNIAPWPLWVRVFAKPGSRRLSVRTVALAFSLIAIIALLICSVEATSDSLLGRAAFFVGAALAPIAALLAVGTFLAMRWVDRHGGWQ